MAKVIIKLSNLIQGNGGVQSVIAGTNVVVDNTDPLNPIVSATTEGIPEAPIDGEIYGRKDAAWEVVAGGGSIIELTYSQLTTAIANSTLIKGQVYLLKDYITTYIQPNTGVSKSSGIVEQLYITATDVNKLHNVAKSKLYPQDIVYYEVTGDIGNGLGNEGFTKGKIYRRIDTLRKNDIGTDWRHVKYDRSGVDKLLFENYTGCANNVVKTYYLFDNVVGTFFQSNTIGDYFYSNTIGVDFSYNTIGDYFYSNTIGDNFYSNTIGESFSYNTIGDYFYSNTIGDYFYSDTIGDYFYSNTIGDGFISNTIGDYFSSNTIGDYFNSDKIGDNFNSNEIGNGFNFNTMPPDINSFDLSKVNNKDFTGLISNINTQRKVYTQANSIIIFSSIDNFGDTIILEI